MRRQIIFIAETTHIYIQSILMQSKQQLFCNVIGENKDNDQKFEYNQNKKVLLDQFLKSFYLFIFIYSISKFKTMKISDLDAFAIKDYQFLVGKVHNYFSFVTVILSSLVIALSILANYETVAHIWLQRKDLLIGLSKSLSLPNSFTSALVCYTSQDPNLNGKIPKIQFFQALGQQIMFPEVSEQQLRKKRPFLADQINSSFGCVDIGQYNFTQLSSFIQTVVNAQSAQLFVEVINQELLLLNKESTFQKIQSNSLIVSIFTFKAINAVIKDVLSINGEPEVHSMIYNEKQPILTELPLSYDLNQTVFWLEFFIPLAQNTQWNKLIMSITRLDLGFIVGAVVSWISIFTLVFSIIVLPVMENSLALLQMRSLFHLPTKFQSPSLIKFTIAHLKKGIFLKEDQYIRLSQKVQILKDIGFLLKAKKTLKKLSYSMPNKNEIMACQHNFSQQIKQQSQAVYFSEPIQAAFLFNLAQMQEKQTNILSKNIRNVLCFFDMRQDRISVSYKQKGHGSRESVCISIIFFIAFTIFLYSFGVFQASKSVKIYGSKMYKKTQYSLKQNEFLLVTDSQQQIFAELIDGNFKTIRNLTLSNNANCLIGRSSDQILEIKIFGSNVYCFDKDIILAHSLQNNEISSLYINNSNLQTQVIWIFHFPTHSTNFYYNPLDHILLLGPTPQNGHIFQSKIKLTKFINSDQSSIASQISSIELVNYSSPINLRGVNIVLNSIQTTVHQKVSTFFDTVQNIWGFATIFFGIILKKITKYINAHKKNIKINQEKAAHREDICTLLSKINQIYGGRHKQQLQRMKYYTKSPIPKRY